MEVFIILTDTGTMFTKLIKRFTKQPLNHASICFTKELDTVYSFGRKQANNPFIGGFVKEDMDGELFQRATCAIYSCSVSESEYWQMKELVQHFEMHQHHYKYNFIGLFGVLLNKKINRKRAFFCSEFVATVLNNGGFELKGKHPSLVRPNDLGNCEEFRLRYEGQLRSYLLQNGNHNAQEDHIKKSRLFHIDTIFLKLVKTVAN